MTGATLLFILFRLKAELLKGLQKRVLLIGMAGRPMTNGLFTAQSEMEIMTSIRFQSKAVMKFA